MVDGKLFMNCGTNPGPPDSPASCPTVAKTQNNGALIEWSSPAFDGGSQITGYVIEMKNSTDKEWKRISGICNSLSYAVKNLDENKKYRFRVRAENLYGQSEPSYDSEEVSFSSDATKEEAEIADKIVAIESGELFKSRYRVLEELGKGRYGVVHKVEDLETGRKMAAKFIRCIKMKDREKVKEEIEIMNFLRHPKLLSLAAAFENPRETVMVMEYISGGELFERVVADDFQLTERDCILFLRQICDGVEYMHRNSIVHLDLKPENIMCQSRNSHEIKLIDFGLAQRLDPKSPVRVLFGTPEFVAPEIINYEPIGFESDMWSIGVICYVLLTGLSPFMGENDAETFANITRATYDFDDEAFDAISQDAKDFISMLLVKRKDKRLTSSECLKNKWMMSEHDKTMKVVLNTDKLKKFIIRRKWQKTGNAIRALGRMAAMSAATRKNAVQNNSQNQIASTVRQEEITPSFKMESTEINNSSLIKACLNKSIANQMKNSCDSEETKESERKKIGSNIFSERTDSGISDCSSNGSNQTYQTTNNLPEKNIPMTEEKDLEISKEEIDTKVNVIRKKFAHLSKNIDEMDRKLETVGKKLEDIGPGKITTPKRPEVKRVPSLKEQGNLNRRNPDSMQPETASNQANVTISLKQPVTCPTIISTLIIPQSTSSDSRIPNLSCPTPVPSTDESKNNQNSAFLPTAKNKLPEGVKTDLKAEEKSDCSVKAQPSTKFQRLQQIYSSTVIPSNEMSGVENFSNDKIMKDINDVKTRYIYGARSINFQEAVAFWKR